MKFIAPRILIHLQYLLFCCHRSMFIEVRGMGSSRFSIGWHPVIYLSFPTTVICVSCLAILPTFIILFGIFPTTSLNFSFVPQSMQQSVLINSLRLYIGSGFSVNVADDFYLTANRRVEMVKVNWIARQVFMSSTIAPFNKLNNVITWTV